MENKMYKKHSKRLISCTLALTLMLSCFVFSLPIQADELTNLALNKTVTAGQEAVASNKTMSKENAVDGVIDVSSYTNTWGLADTTDAWIQIDLGETANFTQMVVYEWKNQNMGGYTLEVSQDALEWTQVSAGTGKLAAETVSGIYTIYKGTISLEKAVSARYVKLTATSVTKWVQISEIEIYNAPISDSDIQPEGNLAAGKSATANQSYSSGDKSTDPAKATDGTIAVNTWANTWGAAAAGDYITIDLGASYTFQQVVVYEYSAQRAQGYTLQISDDNAQWETVSDSDELLASIETSISTNAPVYAGDIRLSEAKKARYLKLTIKDKTTSGASYISEIQVYNEPITIEKAEPTGNLAAGKSVTASHTYTSGSNTANPQYVTDGNKTPTTWRQCWVAFDNGHYITIDLEKPLSFNQMVVYGYNDQNAAGYRVEVSDDNAVWKTASESAVGLLTPKKETALDNDPHFYYSGMIDFDEQTARYVRLTVINKLSTGVARISEIEICNSDGTYIPALSEPQTIEPLKSGFTSLDIYLCLGQSNMGGRDEIPAADLVVQEDAFLLNRSGEWEKAQAYYGTDGKTITGYNRYTTTRSTNTSEKMNPALSFSRAVAKYAPEDTAVGIICNAHGGTTIEQWSKGYVATETRPDYGLYAKAVERTQAAIAAGGTLKGILWLQGESCAAKEGYLTKLKAVADNLRTDLGVTADQVPFIVSQVIPGRDVQNAVFASVAGTIDNSDYISSEGTTSIGDNLHFDAQSARLLGLRYAEKILAKNYSVTKTEGELMEAIYTGTQVNGTPPSLSVVENPFGSVALGSCVTFGAVQDVDLTDDVVIVGYGIIYHEDLAFLTDTPGECPKLAAKKPANGKGQFGIELTGSLPQGKFYTKTYVEYKTVDGVIYTSYSVDTVVHE